MKKNITFLAFLLSIFILNAQDPNILWQRTIGGSNWDEPIFTILTTDNGLFMGGHSRSNSSGEKTEDSRGGRDYWILKLDASGTIEWQRTIGGDQQDYLMDAKQTADGGYILAGYSNSGISGEKTENSQGSDDYWIIKMNATGTIEWQNTIGGDADDRAQNVEITADGGYLIAGTSDSGISGDRTVLNNGDTTDTWIVKLDENGALAWQRAHSYIEDTSIMKIFRLTNDGGYVIGGSDYYGPSGEEYVVMKVAADGNTVWEKSYGGDNGDTLTDLILTSDGGYIAVGYSFSNASGDKTEDSRGWSDYWIVKLDADGNFEWDKTLGGSEGDTAYSTTQTADGVYLVTGTSSSNISGDKTEDGLGQPDYWIVKINEVGIIEGQNTIGGRYLETNPLILLSADGSFTISGASTSDISGDKTEDSRGGYDFWIIHHAEILGITENPFNDAISLYPNPVKNTLQINSQGQNIDQLNIYAVTGSRIIHADVNAISPTVDVSNLATGVYYLQLHSGKKIAVKKFIKQ